MITIYTLTYNEELLIQFMIDHYRSRFPGCHIVVYDNNSTDRTVEIAKANGCEIRGYPSGNTLNDGLHAQIKNTCWKDAKTDWVLTCDLDELLDITSEELKYEESIGSTIIKTESWSLVNMENNLDFKSMNHGFRDSGYDKSMLFNKKFIKEMNYGVGCHNCNPIGTVKFSKPYSMYHYKYINADLIVQKSAETAKRLSDINRKNKWGHQCLRDEAEIRRDFEYIQKNMSQKIEMRDLKMKITIYTVTYNEELLMQLMIDHYRSRFPDCHIVVYDNQSTDRTVEIAKANGCEIRHYDSGGEVNDQMLWDTKNTCWKDAKTDWVLVCDLDEMLDINEQQLISEAAKGVTKIKCECYHMVNMEDNLDVKNITFGARNPKDTVYDKDLLFNKKYVDINYINNDCHFTNSKGIIKDSKPYLMYHYKYVNPDIFVNKQKTSAKRLSEINKKNGWGAQCLRDEGSFRSEFQQARDAAIKILGKFNHFYQNIQGWFNYQQFYTDMVKSLPKNSHIVEIGAWKGCSSAYLATEIYNSGKNIKLDVVDLWTGEEDDPTAFTTDTEFMAYNKNIYPLFMKNLSPIYDKINMSAIQMSSAKASQLYDDKSLDFVFIDANHSYKEVKNDILNWLPKLKSGATFAGHDYNPNSFPGVIQAVNELFPNNFTVVGDVWFTKVK